MEDNYIYEVQTGLTEENCTNIVEKINEVINKYKIDTKDAQEAFVYDENKLKFKRQDTQLNITPFCELQEINNLVLDLTANALIDYVQKYSSIVSCYETLTNTTLKYQKTAKSGGYHVFHIEHSPAALYNTRVLTWILYLNSFEDNEAGETEFLHFPKRIVPKAGLLALWPAYWPWVHRGNPPYKEKHVITGWFDAQVLDDFYKLSEVIKAK